MWFHLFVIMTSAIVVGLALFTFLFGSGLWVTFKWQGRKAVK